MTPYAELEAGSQVELLRVVALQAAAEFGLAVDRLELVLHSYNTTFRIDTTDGRTLALRVGTNSGSSPANLLAHQVWTHAIRTETDVLVPDPQIAPDGRTVVDVASVPAGRSFLCVVNSWLDGPDVGVCDPEQALALGTAMATLHTHASEWRLPAGAELPTFRTPLFGDEDLLTGSRFLSTDDRRVVDAAMAASASAFTQAYADARLIPLHADLHGGNLKWHNGKLAVFDFDDSGLGIPLLDLAIAIFYLRDGTDAGSAAESALLEGYSARRRLPDLSRLDALIAARQLLLANAMLASSTADWRDRAAPYLGVAVERLSRWLDTGRFSR